jgi:S1-C subfamily serine protease
VSLGAVSALATLFAAVQPSPAAVGAQPPAAVQAARPPAAGVARPAPADTGRDIHGEVRETRGAARLYLFTIPGDAVRVDVALVSPDGGAEMRAVCAEAPPERDEDWPWAAFPEGERAELSLNRHAETDLRPGPFLVEVRPMHDPGRQNRRRTLAFALRVEVQPLRAPVEVVPGARVDAATSPEDGHRRDFVLDLPPGAKSLRIDLVETARDLDLLASSQGPPLDADAAEWEAATALARESVIIGDGSGPKLPARGRLWFSVVDPSLYDAPVRFRVVASLGSDPPAEALPLPELPHPADPRALALAAAVEIVQGDGTGSGTIVSADGLVLTARHVVGGQTNGGADLVVAMNLDPTNITRDLFRARVVRTDEGLDVALLQITSGLYGQPLPRGYRFPACPLSLEGLPGLGDELVTIGFPEPGGTGTRAPVMLSRGVVSGFERERTGLRIKTDAFVASGSSGGAALDARYRLVGVPVFTMSDSDRAALLGFLVPVTELPREWLALIRK